jgi:hypothetical protein
MKETKTNNTIHSRKTTRSIASMKEADRGKKEVKVEEGEINYLSGREPYRTKVEN